MRHTRRGVTFTDLIIVLVLVGLTAPMLVRALGRSRESAVRVKCGSNLRQIGQAMMLYAIDNRGEYPRTVYKPGAPPTQFTGVFAPNPFAAGGPAPNDVTAALFLLLRTQEITSDPFVCPSTTAEPWTYAGKTVSQVSNFPDEHHLSYSLANPYPDGIAVTKRAPFGDTTDRTYAVAADMNPGTADGFDVTSVSAASPAQAMMRSNTWNHQGAGQNVLYADGHVDFQQNPFVGHNGDHIYTVAGSADGQVPTSGTIVGLPTWVGDSVLLPVATTDPHVAPPAQGYAAAIAAGVIVFGLGLAVAVYRRRRAAAGRKSP